MYQATESAGTALVPSLMDDEHRWRSSSLIPHVGRSACARCGATGYVYLWSVGRDGTRGWFCDRSTCKRFWYTGSTRRTSFRDELVPELQPLVLNSDQRVPQTV